MAEITTDGRTIWINGADGCCLGRFSRFGIDVHRSFAEQAAGIPECLDCTHERPDLAAWRRFQDAMLRYHGVAVMDRLRPSWVR